MDNSQALELLAAILDELKGIRAEQADIVEALREVNGRLDRIEQGIDLK